MKPVPVTLVVTDGLAVITIDNPPINAGSQAVRAGLIAALQAAQAQGAVGAVVTGAGPVFIAGSDLKEFGQPLASPELPDVITAIEAAPFPVVAAMHGVALGGGFELALACDYRLAAPDTKLGLPEVSLGMVPGAGGTQRLARLVGQARAMDLICAAKRIDAVEALAIGAIDAVIDGDLLAGALAFLRAEKRPKRRVIAAPVPAESADAVDAAARRAQQQGSGRPSVTEAVRLIRLSSSPDPATALADERATFQRLRLGEDAFALRYLFFAERRAGVVKGLDPKSARPIARVGIVGGGTMGQGIAKAVLAAGLPVLLVERDEAGLGMALGAIEKSLAQGAEKGWLSPEDAALQQALLSGATRIPALGGCDLVIEAVFEDMEVKRQVLAGIEAVVGRTAIIATNTSYLDINAMTDQMAQPERSLGLHFFSPADRMALLEIVRADRTSDATLATGLAFAKALKKQPVVARVGEGFIGNRIYAAYRRRAELLVLDGAMPEAVDGAARDFGFKMGPFEVSDLAGLDIAWATRTRLAPTRDPFDRYVTIADTLCEAGRLGRKAGKGWYDYATGKPLPDSAVAAFIEDARHDAGVTPRTYHVETLQRQLLAAMVNEAACLIEDGIAGQVSDVDVVLANGYGFPRWRGGPIHWASQVAPDLLNADLSALALGIGHGFRRGAVRAILEDFKATTKA